MGRSALSERAEPTGFWRQALAVGGSATPRVVPNVVGFAAFSALVVVLHGAYPVLHFPIGPVEVSGAALALILILRTSSGHDRWWEGRKLWGAIVNQTRNIGTASL